MHLHASMLLASALAFPAVDAVFAACVHGQESPLVFQGNLFDALPEPFFPTMFRTRDLDGDGFPDLVIAGRDPDDRVMTRRGDGNGRGSSRAQRRRRQRTTAAPDGPQRRRGPLHIADGSCRSHFSGRGDARSERF